MGRFELKYFRKVLDAQAGAPAPDPLPPFDIAPFLTRSRFRQWFGRFAFRKLMPAAFAVLRAVRPIARIGRLVIVSRDADVRDVLSRPQDFAVPFGPEMTELAGGTNSVLGTEGTDHQRVRTILQQALKPEDLANIRRWSRGYAEALLDGGAGRIDVFTDLFTRVATETCGRYFGLTLHDPVAFGHWTLAVSSQIFADPFGDPETRVLALNGATRIRSAIQDAIARVRENDAMHPHSRRPRETLIDRLVTGGMHDGEIISNIIGLATGFIPTNTLAAGNMLEELLSDPRLFEAARVAAADRSDPGHTKLRHVLLEAGRRNPALSPGQWRHLTGDATIGTGNGQRRLKQTRDPRRPVIILAGIMSALRDPRSQANRSGDPEQAAGLLFGWGSHSCLGRAIALEQIVQTFAALLTRPQLAVARGGHGWMQRMGPFPVRMDMTFASSSSTQSMIIVSAPVRDGTLLEAVQQEIDALGNPAGPTACKSLDDTGIVHFASLSAIDSGHGSSSYPILLLELNVDGAREEAIAAIAEKTFAWLAPIMRHGREGGEPFSKHEELASFLQDQALALHCKPWGPIGVHYNGTPEFSVRDIERQEHMAKFARDALDDYFEDHIGRRGRAMEALTRVRRFARQDPFYQLKQSGRWPKLNRDGSRFEFSIVRPSRKRLRIANWQAPKSWLAPVGKLLASRDGVGLGLGFALLALASGVAIGFLFGPVTGGLFFSLRTLLLSGLATLGGILLAALIVAVTVSALALILAAKERRDPVDSRNPDFSHIERLSRRENAEGFEQNHILAVMPLKPGRFRKLVFAFALWGIRQSVTHWFRPGFVVTMGTIHYAKWFRVPGTEQFAFLSNYDGNWESYLEDFITRAHWGQTAAWSNGVGFPRTRFLILDGARDGDRFKRWVRRQQQETRFWYSRFPHLTTRQIRSNALIEDGLAHAVSDTDARRWLACFGSAQREDHEIEAGETQSILFSGFGHLHYATCLLVRLPGDPAMQALWLKLVSGQPVGTGGKSLIGPDLAPFLSGNRARRELRVAFGDNPPADGAAVLGLTARGLSRLGLGERDGSGGLSQFPAAFNFGMAGRASTLGDIGTGAAGHWRWSDRYDASGSNAGADAALIVYGQRLTDGDRVTADSHAELVKAHKLILLLCGGAVLHEVPTTPLLNDEGKPTLHLEHFGFRDGISQPVIRGTQRVALGVPGRDLVEPGEVILGYRNNQGFYPPVIGIADEKDYANDLPGLNAGGAGRFPRFGAPGPEAVGRDFGRNGSFLVIRELDQDVDGFRDALERHAAAVKSRYGDAEGVLGHRIDADWVAAKMIGRWRDGRPLVGNPPPPAALLPTSLTGAPELTPPDLRLQNDFAFGRDDPRGYQCPLGAHIRRANPRDSLEPGDQKEEFITNRHRLLRRGRSYSYAADGDGQERKGLLFMALCADLERQFEFVQHSWLNASTFHGLTDEGDPVAGPDKQRLGGKARSFTIPTPAGPLTLRDVHSYVSVRGGGYFFLPSLAALKYLATQASSKITSPAPATIPLLNRPSGRRPRRQSVTAPE